MGRPTAYTAELATAICERLTAGDSLRSICSSEEMPAEATVRLWNTDDRQGFAARYVRAREQGFEARAEAAVTAAKTAEDASKGRLAFDAERWYLGKLSNAFSDNKPQSLKHEHTLSDEAKAWLGLS